MKIIIEHERGEGGTTLAQVLYKFLTMLPYNLEWKEKPEAAKKHHLNEVPDIANENLYEVKDVTIETRSKRREIPIVVENILSGKILTKAENFFAASGITEAILMLPREKISRLEKELQHSIEDGDILVTPYGKLSIVFSSSRFVVTS